MEIDIRMPALPAGEVLGALTKWLVAAGSVVKRGDILAEVATPRATLEIEAEADGEILAILVAAGASEVAANAVLARMSQAVGDPAAAPASAPSAPPRAPGRTISVRDALRDALAEEMRRDQTVIVLGEEVAEYNGPHKVTQGLLDEFGPQRVIDTPITEHAFAGIGVGAAMAGLRPVVEFMSFSFALQAADHIVNSAAKARYLSGGRLSCPVVFRGPNGAAPGVGAQHAADFSAMYAHVPGLIVLAPYSAADAKGLLKSAIRDPNPVVFLENEILYGESFEAPVEADALVPIGVARTAREGRDVTIVSFSIGVGVALKAAELLARDGVEAEVIDLRTLRPLDRNAVVASVRKTGHCVSVEEGWPQSGVGAEIAALLMEEAFDALMGPMQRVTGANAPMPYAASLERLTLPVAADVAAAAMRALRRRNA